MWQVATVAGLMASRSIQSALSFGTTNSKDQVMRQVCDSALESLQPAWDALEEWLALIADEIKQNEADTSSDTASSTPQASPYHENVAAPSTPTTTASVPDAATHERDAASVATQTAVVPPPTSLQSNTLAPPPHPTPANARAPIDASGTDTPHKQQTTKDTTTTPIPTPTRHGGGGGGGGGGVVDMCGDRVATAIYGFALVISRVEQLDIEDDASVAPRLFEFTTRHAPVIRQLIAREPQIIFSRFSFVLSHLCLHRLFGELVRAQPFEDRQKWFHEQIGLRVNTSPQSRSDPRVLRISRKEVFNSSCRAFADLDTNQPGGAAKSLQVPFQVQFEGEAGIGEGVKREWISLLSREMLNEDYGLFVASSDGSTFQPNPNSYITPDHLSYFEFAGKAVGLALLHRQLLGVTFTRVFYKQLCGKPADYNDAATIDPEYAKSLEWILDNDITDLDLDLTFSTSREHFGAEVQTELIPNGANIAVTEENKQGFVHLVASQKLSGAVRLQVQAFSKGFNQIIPKSLVSLFDEYELELLLSGVPSIDVDDWQTNCGYSGYTADSDQVTLFFEVARGMTQPERALVLQFATGSARVPPGGFASLRGNNGICLFTLSEDAGASTDNLPTASTCFNLLKLPHYATAETMRARLLLATRHGAEGFEFT